jgi:hypothetical protein
MTEKKKKHRQHKDVSMNSRGILRVGGMSIPYYPAYMWGGMWSDNKDSDTTTNEGDHNAGDSGASSGDGGSGSNG